MLNGETPPESGLFFFEVERAPVSLQANPNKKMEFKEFITSKLEKVSFMLTGDIKISIEWFIHEKKRYETSSSADIDNIIKPLMDSLCGPQGIMVDDNQVQSVNCHWLDYHDLEKEKIVITVEFFPTDFVLKEGLFFVEVDKNLYMPLWESLDKKAQKAMVELYEQGIKIRDMMVANAGFDYYSAKSVMAGQRVFHKGRLEGFVLKKKTEV
ncbi:hypothetical protein RJ43_00020 [Alteromonas macleodii]|uniref:RusA family crossover junction endodeoxyribonuclease n=1 Tax=Alteromonas macleodii TaxID=28108 RepID=UPI0005802C97|nr:RusA family crossover junction endodeoxyribonuclease [Alteromonas macleodii]KHT56813.1 hypothetical protein RJ43_00020 [Alteromonas macleodii]